MLRVPGVAQVNIYGERLAAAPRAGRPGEAGRERRLARPGDGDRRPTPLDAGVLQYADSFVVGTGGFVEAGRPAAERPQRAADRQSRRTSAKVPVVRSERQARCASSDVASVKRGPPAALGRRRHQRRPRPDADRPEVPRRQHAGGHAGRRGGDGRDAARPSRHARSTRRSSGRRPSSSSRSTTSRRRCCIGILLVVLIIAAFLFEWRTAFISLIAIPLSLLAAILVLDLRGATINVMVLAGLVVAIGVVVDDAIIDVENIVRRLRQARARGQRQVDVRGSCSTPRSRCARAITYATRDQRRRDRAGVLPRGPVRLRSSSRWCSPTGSRCWSRCWSR